jgi:hypothetical protein
MENPLDDLSAPVVHPGLRKKLLIDIIAQVSGIVLVILLFMTNVGDYTPAFVAFYFGVGTYQLISSLVHFFFQKKPSPLYRMYYIQLCVHLFFFLGIFSFLGILGALALLYLSPITALYYFIITIITYNEVRPYAKQ